MPRALFLNIGVSSNDGHAGPIGTALGCAEAAEAMADIATNLHSKSILLTDERAEYEKVWKALDEIKRELHPKDLFVLTLAGHGTMLDGPGHLGDVHDQATVLYDDYLIDDEIHDWCAELDPAINVVVIADGCYFGTIIMRLDRLRQQSTTGTQRAAQGGDPPPLPNVLLLASSPSNGIASAVLSGGLTPFTRALVKVWRECATYAILRDRIEEELPPGNPTPVLFPPNSGLINKEPFVA